MIHTYPTYKQRVGLLECGFSFTTGESLRVTCSEKRDRLIDLLRFDSKLSATMNDADVGKQIQQMVRFIRQEAEEKANEIAVSAEEVRPPIRLF